MSNADVDVLVVGAGLTGAMIAAQLAERGARVGVVDAQRVGHGATARALGVAAPDPSSPHFAETARGMDLLRALADRLNIKLQSCISLHTAGNEQGVAALQHTASAHAAMHMEWMAHPELLPRGYDGGLLVHDSALVDLDRLMMRLLQHPRITVRQHAEVTRLELNGQNTYAVSRESTFSARCVVLATNAYVGLLSPYLADSVTVTRGCTFTSHPLRDGTATKYVMPTLIDGGRLMLSPGKDSRVNASAWQLNGAVADPYETLRTFLRRTDLHLSEQAESWHSGVTTLALDGMPLVGRLDTGTTGGNVLYALGLGPFGLAWAPVVAEKVAALAV